MGAFGWTTALDRLRRGLSDPELRENLKAEVLAAHRAATQTGPWAIRARLGVTPTLLSVALRNAKRDPDGLAFEMDERRYTWAQLADASSRIAHVLRDAGIRQGDVIAALGPNSPFYVALILGATRVGATAALINTHLSGRPLAHAVRSSGAKIAVVEKRLERTLRSADDLTDVLKNILVYGGGPLDARLAEASGTPFTPAPVTHTDDYVYIYTSGTTGLPKPCRVSHARSIIAAAGFGPLMFNLQKGDKVYCVLPLYHSSALLLGVGSTILAGVPMALRESFSASAFWDDVDRYGATAMLYIGELCRYLLNSPTHPKEKQNHIRVAVGNGLRPDIWKPFQERFGIRDIHEFYGATEAPGIIMNFSGKEGSVGRLPFNGLGQLRLVRYDIERDAHLRNDDGFLQEAATGQPGELLIRISGAAPPGLDYRGYTDEKATQKKILHDVFKRGDSYFRSGDILRQDEDGFFYFVDRIGDTYRWKGENVSTNEVADVLGEAEGVREATVVGVQVPDMEGRAGLAAIIPDEGFDIDALWRTAQTLPQYAQPRFVRLLDSFDTTATFKIQKTKLREDGVDPLKLSDQLFVRTDRGFESLDETRWNAIRQGELRL